MPQFASAVNMLLVGYALRLGCIVWYVNRLLILVAADILRSHLHLLIQKWMTILKSKSIHLIYVLILIEHRAQVDSTSTVLILRCVLLMNPQLLWCSVRTTVRNIKIKHRLSNN